MCILNRLQHPKRMFFLFHSKFFLTVLTANPKVVCCDRNTSSQCCYRFRDCFETVDNNKKQSFELIINNVNSNLIMSNLQSELLNTTDNA